MHLPANEVVTLSRDIVAARVPAGDKYALPAGTECRITQALGGSFTIFVEGHLFRVEGKDADALGKEVAPMLTLPENATDSDVEKLVWDQLRTCFDPEIPIDIVELGLVYECRVEKQADDTRKVFAKMTLTAPGCGMGEYLVQDVRGKLLQIPTVTEANVELVFDPPWNQSMMSEAARLQAGLI
jgi:probable FeS assembly SUF system protein SufT